MRADSFSAAYQVIHSGGKQNPEKVTVLDLDRLLRRIMTKCLTKAETFLETKRIRKAIQEIISAVNYNSCSAFGLILDAYGLLCQILQQRLLVSIRRLKLLVGFILVFPLQK